MTNKRLHKRAEEHDGLEAWRGELERTKADQAKALEQRRDEVAPSASPTAQGERAAFTCMCCNQVAKIRLDMRNAEVAKATKKVEAARSTVHEWRISTEEQKAVQADGLDVCPRRSTPPHHHHHHAHEPYYGTRITRELLLACYRLQKGRWRQRRSGSRLTKRGRRRISCHESACRRKPRKSWHSF